MNKRLISFLVVISTFFLIGNVQAIEMDKDDIEKGSYVIGTHLFERKQTQHYDGTLTVQHIMLAAQSIGSNDINDMVIYLKNSRGKWVNGLTNESITVPENFEIEYKNVEKIPEFASYGDVNSDGEIDIFDAVAVLQYIDGQIEFSEEQKKSADVNVDGYIDLIDRHLILGFSSNYFPNTLPSKPITDYVLYGDVLNSGDPYADKEGGMPIYVMQQYVSGNISSLEGQALKNADINGDGKVDHIDSAIIFWYVNDELKLSLPSFTPITDYTLYGDVNNDGIVNDRDWFVLSRFINNQDTLSKQGFKNADINADGKVDNVDVEIIKRAIEIGSFDGDIPAIKPIYKYTITFDSNGGSTVPNGSAITYDKVSEPTVPTKEGYMFQGWYLDEEFYNFNSSITSDITLVAKWDPIVYEINYDKNASDATGVMESSFCDYGQDCELKNNEFKRLGYKFVGWSTTSDGEVEYSSDTTLTVKNLTSTNGESITLYAVWELVIGDVNADGFIDAKDFMVVHRYLAGTETISEDRLLAADVNQDGVVDYVDVQVILMYWDKDIQELPYKTGTKYTITYNLNDGIVIYNPTEYISNTRPITIENPTREGYKFLGWTGSNGEKVQTDVIIPADTTGNLTYTANWISIEDIPEVPTIEPMYAVWLNTGVYTGVIEMCETGAYDYQNKPIGAELYEKTDSGYTLIDSVTNTCVLDFEINPGETKVYSVRVYINYDEENKVYSNYSNELIIKNENIITYDLNGGINSSNNKFGYSPDYPYQRELEAPTKAGYTFLGWTGSNGDTPQVEVSIPLDTTGHLHYIANWELTDESTIDKTIPLAPTIERDPQYEMWTISGLFEGHFDYCKTGVYSDESGFDGAELYVKTSSGYTLVDSVENDCWLYFELNPGEAKVYTARVYTLDEENNKVYSNYSNEVLLKNENVITYDLDGGVNSVYNTIGYSYSRTKTLELPTKEGYTFLGWTGSNGETPQLVVTIPGGTTGILSYVANWEKAE